MAIIYTSRLSFTPEVFPEDPTRLPEFYDGTYNHLKSLGLEEL